MRFVDETSIEVIAGDGGDGCVAFRREKFIPLGGPSGGDGGRGGSVIFEAASGLTSLLDLGNRKRVQATSGEHGRGKDQYGKSGKDEVVRVPLGTQVFDSETGVLIFDLDEAGKQAVVAKGGTGGKGNMHFVTPYNKAPRKFEYGEKGERKRLRLELKLMADVGVIGFPNVGKSTLISTVSKARPKIADYPFTTLAPSLGVVSLGLDRNFVMADIPGIIEGASEGAGLGLRFLRHVERTRVLLHLITLDADPDREPFSDFEKLNAELQRFNPELAKRPMIVALSKMDLPDVANEFEELKEKFSKMNFQLFSLSAGSREGLNPLLLEIEKVLLIEKQKEQDEKAPELIS